MIYDDIDRNGTLISIQKYIRDPSKQMHAPESIDLCQQHRLQHDFLIGIQRLWNIRLRMPHATAND